MEQASREKHVTYNHLERQETNRQITLFISKPILPHSNGGSCPESSHKMLSV